MPSLGKFSTLVKGVEYSLEYNELSTDLWEFHCPYTANSRDGKKEREIREKLIEYALFYMARNRIKILESGSCMSVREYLAGRKELQHLVVEEES